MTLNILRLLVFFPLFCIPAWANDLRQQNGQSAEPASPASRERESIREILDLERQSKDAAVQRDPQFSQRTLAEDYMAITPLGQVITKGDTIAARRSGQLRYESIEINDVVVRLYGNTAIVTARANVKGVDLGEEFNGAYRFTRVWVRRNGRWLAASYQATVTR
jgi:ketosteroid isomerase-like protein